MLALHIKRMDEGTLAKLVFDEQIEKKWPGLAQEADVICHELGVQNFQLTKLSQKLYRSKLVEASHVKNEELIKNQIQGKVKCERIFEEKYM